MSGGQKFDQGKLQYDLIPFECLDELAKILTYGVVKYGKPSGWQHVENMEDRYFAATMRHLSAYRQGEKLDAESGHRHLSHALCNVVFLLWKELQGQSCLHGSGDARETAKPWPDPADVLRAPHRRHPLDLPAQAPPAASNLRGWTSAKPSMATSTYHPEKASTAAPESAPTAASRSATPAGARGSEDGRR